MKKLVTILLIVALAVLIYYAVWEGITIGNFKISSVSQIAAQNDELDAQIEELNKLSSSTYPSKVSELNSQIKSLLSEKQKYLDLANLSSDSEIQDATKEESYSIDYLWARVGNHATQEGVNLKMEKQSAGIEGLSNLSFTINGSYVAIINFISSLEKDSKLNFRIENFKVTATETSTSSATSSKLQGSFLVRNIGIQEEAITEDTTTTTTTTTTQGESTTNTTTTDGSDAASSQS